MYKLREKRLREFYTTGEVLKDVQSADPHSAIREETPKRGGTTYRELVVGELRAGDHFDIREKTAEQTTELIQTSDGSPQEIHTSLTESVTVILGSRTVVSESSTTFVDSQTTLVESHSESTGQESDILETVMLDSRTSPERILRESPSPSRSSSRRSSKSSPTREASSRKSSVSSEIKLATSPTREVPSRKSSATKMSSPTREVSSRKSSTTETHITTSSQREVSSRRSSETKLASPSREVSSRLSNCSDSRKSVSPAREVSSRKSSVSENRVSPIRDTASVRKSSTSSSETKMVVSPTKDSADELQYSTFTSVTLVKQHDGGRVTSPNRRKLSSAGSKARRAGTPSASPPRSPTHEKEQHEESSDEEISTVKDIKSKFEDTSKPKSILRTPDRKKSAVEAVEAIQKVSEITMQVVQEPVEDITKEVKKQEIKVEPQAAREVKRSFAEVKLESSREVKKSELTKKVETKQEQEKKSNVQTKIAVKDFQKEARASSIRRRSREQVEDSSERDSSCSPVRSRTHSKSKVTPNKAEVTATTTTTVTTTATLKRPTKLPMLNNKKTDERTCCGRRHGATSPDKPWRQSPMQSPKKTSPTTKAPQKAANRSPSSSPERPTPVESRTARRPVAQKSPVVTSPTKRAVESPVKKPVTDRAATTSCLKSPEVRYKFLIINLIKFFYFYTHAEI